MLGGHKCTIAVTKRRLSWLDLVMKLIQTIQFDDAHFESPIPST